MRKGEVCGACTGALMALGLKYGQSAENDIESRLKTNEVTDFFVYFLLSIFIQYSLCCGIMQRF